LNSGNFNALTVDVEDWYHVCDPVREPAVSPEQWRVRDNVELILELLAYFRVRATFFVLGSVAEALPDLVPLIARQGHEIASHGYSHRLVSQLSPATFREELRRTADILGAQAGSRPSGFRAPRWSLSAATSWAFDILAEEGYRYDSSCAPLPFVGDPAGSRTPYRKTAGGRQLWEIPPLVTPSPLGNLPTGGGWGLRFFPLRLIGATVRSLNRNGAPAVIFLHPRELDPTGPRVKLPLLQGFATYGSRRDVAPRLRQLLSRFQFVPLGDLIEIWDSV
jgi:peptidoglycan-N-acetylglucosamine deacetylase